MRSIVPSSARTTSGSARTHCATMPSSGVRAGSCGAAGSPGSQRITLAAAAIGSWCGRLPMPVARPDDKRLGGMRSVVYGRPLHSRPNGADPWCGPRGPHGSCFHSRPAPHSTTSFSHGRTLLERRPRHCSGPRGSRGSSRCWRPGRGASRSCASSRRLPSLAVASAWSAPWLTATVAILSAVVALATALSSPVAHACAASTAYGPEQRFPLRVPISLLAGPLPISVVAVGAGIACGPLLLADGNVVAGIGALIVGAPIVFLLARSLTALDRRWIVLVPAGLVVVDPLTFPDPVLLPREHIASIRISPIETVANDEREIRAGGPGVLLITCREAGSFLRRSGRGRVTVEADRIRVSPVRPGVVLRGRGPPHHRLPDTTPPPSTTSPS